MEERFLPPPSHVDDPSYAEFLELLALILSHESEARPSADDVVCTLHPLNSIDVNVPFNVCIHTCSYVLFYLKCCYVSVSIYILICVCVCVCVVCSVYSREIRATPSLL